MNNKITIDKLELPYYGDEYHNMGEGNESETTRTIG
jgi:hypothetical protein